MGAKNIVLSTNVPLKNDGKPYATFKTPDDVGVAVYFLYQKKQLTLACDMYKSIEENTHAICKTIEAIRGIERWGASEMLERAFTGFAQLEAPGAGPKKREWWEILHVHKDYTWEQIKDAYRREAKKAHPDNGGSNEQMTWINRAYEEAQKLHGRT
jgi:DnaJ-domain-containing protein 1